MKHFCSIEAMSKSHEAHLKSLEFLYNSIKLKKSVEMHTENKGRQMKMSVKLTLKTFLLVKKRDFSGFLSTEFGGF